MRFQQLVTSLAGLSMVLALVACQTEKTLPEQRFDLRGKVISVDRNEGTVTLAHEAIPGYMAAMTMAYPVKDKWTFDVLKPSQSLRATLVVASDRAWLEGIVISEEPKPEGGPLAPAKSAHPSPGEEVPDIPLVNQDGKQIHLHQYHGKSLLLTFIYTRCPLPDYCPLLSKKFAQILQEMRSEPAVSRSTHLLSISIDPEYDKPAVLRAYGLNCAGGALPFAHWEFGTGTPEQIKKVAGFFGLEYWTEGGQIVHTLVTALVGPDGKILQVYRGNDWRPKQVWDDVRRSLQERAAAR